MRRIDKENASFPLFTIGRYINCSQLVDIITSSWLFDIARLLRASPSKITSHHDSQCKIGLKHRTEWIKKYQCSGFSKRHKDFDEFVKYNNDALNCNMSYFALAEQCKRILISPWQHIRYGCHISLHIHTYSTNSQQNCKQKINPPSTPIKCTLKTIIRNIRVKLQWYADKWKA